MVDAPAIELIGTQTWMESSSVEHGPSFGDPPGKSRPLTSTAVASRHAIQTNPNDGDARCGAEFVAPVTRIR